MGSEDIGSDPILPDPLLPPASDGDTGDRSSDNDLFFR